MFRVIYYSFLTALIVTVFCSSDSLASQRASQKVVIKGLQPSDYRAPKPRPEKPYQRDPIPSWAKLTESEKRTLSNPPVSLKDYLQESDKLWEEFCAQERQKDQQHKKTMCEIDRLMDDKHQKEMRAIAMRTQHTKVEMENDRLRHKGLL